MTRIYPFHSLRLVEGEGNLSGLIYPACLVIGTNDMRYLRGRSWRLEEPSKFFDQNSSHLSVKTKQLWDLLSSKKAHKMFQCLHWCWKLTVLISSQRMKSSPISLKLLTASYWGTTGGSSITIQC